MPFPTSVAETKALLAAHGYLAGDALATPVFLALKLGRPLLLEVRVGWVSAAATIAIGCRS